MSYDDQDKYDVDIKRCDSCDMPFPRGELYHVMGFDICHECREASLAETIEDYYGYYHEA